MSKPRLESIDMARGVSILLVAAFHANTTSSINGFLSDLRMPLFFLYLVFYLVKGILTIQRHLLGVVSRPSLFRTFRLPLFFTCFGYYVQY